MLWLALLLACRAPDPEPSGQTMTVLPPFEDPAVEPVYQRLAAWADGLGWTSTPLRRGGAYLERTWIRGEPGKGKVPAAGTARLALSVFASSKPSSSYGLEWSAGITDDTGLGVSLLVVSGARGFTPDQARIDLHRGADAPAELGAPLTWKLGERVLQTERPSGLAEVQAKLAAYRGPSFAGEAARDLQTLEAVVRPVLESGDYTMCDYGPSPGGGDPWRVLPACADRGRTRGPPCGLRRRVDTPARCAWGWRGVDDPVGIDRAAALMAGRSFRPSPDAAPRGADPGRRPPRTSAGRFPTQTGTNARPGTARTVVPGKP